MKTVKMLKGSFHCGETYIAKGRMGEVEDHVALDLVKRGKASVVKTPKVKTLPAPAAS